MTNIGNNLPPVPESLKETWNKASSDGKITKKEYSELVKTAAPMGENKEFDSQELEFLSSLKEKFGNSDSIPVNKKGTADTNIKFIDSEIPNSVKKEYKEAIKDSKVSEKEYSKILKAAAPNSLDSELCDKEVKFLSKLKNKIENSESKSDYKSEILNKEKKQSKNEDSINKKYDVPSSLKESYKEALIDGKISKDEFHKLLNQAAPNKKNDELSEDEINFLANLKEKINNDN